MSELIQAAGSTRASLHQTWSRRRSAPNYSQRTHQTFFDAGFYCLYVPKRHGSHQFGLSTYVWVLIELDRGCVFSAWSPWDWQ